MGLPRDYTSQSCSLARALEVVGERWTLLIVRDAFYGVRRFSDFLVHLQVPRAVLADRLSMLVGAGVLERVPAGGHDEYVTTAKGRALWPVVHNLVRWGDEFYAELGPRRFLVHAGCGNEVDASSHCPSCDVTVELGDLAILPGPGLAEDDRDDPVSVALARPHRLLEPLDTKARGVPAQDPRPARS